MDKIRNEGQFREDFYYRLCSDVIHIPSLRQRLEENPEGLTEILQFTVRQILGTRSPQIVNLDISWKNNQVRKLPNNINWLYNLYASRLKLQFVPLKSMMEKQIFHPAGESIRPAIPRRLWGRHIMYIASPKSPWLAGRLNS